MKSFYIILDYNDADYFRYVVIVEDEVFEKFKPLIKAIAEFEPYVCPSSFGEVIYNNWISNREDLGDKSIYEIYSQFSKEYIDEFIDKFLYYSCPDYEYGATFHTIVKFQEIFLGDNLIDGDYQSVKERTPQKVKDYEKERAELYSYKRLSDGKPYNCIPFAEMTQEEEEIGRKLDNLWKKYQ